MSSNETTPTPPKPSASSSDLFRKPKEERRSALTHEKIADDLAAFQRGGGKIEVLGTTHTLKSMPAPAAPGAAPAGNDTPAAKPAK